MPRVRKFRYVLELGMIYALTPEQYREYLGYVARGTYTPSVRFFGKPYIRIDADATDLSEDQACSLLAEIQDDT